MEPVIDAGISSIKCQGCAEDLIHGTHTVSCCGYIFHDSCRIIKINEEEDCPACRNVYEENMFKKCELAQNPKFRVVEAQGYLQLQNNIEALQQDLGRLEVQLQDANRALANLRGQSPDMVVVQEDMFRVLMQNAILWQNHVAAQPRNEEPIDHVENGH